MAKMRQYTFHQFVQIIEANGYDYVRCNGDHVIYKRRGAQRTIVLAKKKHINPCIARRLIKENELIVS